MRKSFYTLSGIVIGEMQRDVRSGEVYIFINRHQTIMKILHMEYAGMVIYHKKLDSGRFKLPRYDETTQAMTLPSSSFTAASEYVALSHEKNPTTHPG